MPRSNYGRYIDTSHMTELTCFMATSRCSNTQWQSVNWAHVLPALTALRTLMLHIPGGRKVREQMAACRQLQHLRNLQLDLDKSGQQLHGVNLSLPTQLTALTVLSDQRTAPWHKTLAGLKRLQVLTVQQEVLCHDQDVLTSLTALTKLVLLTGTSDNKGGGLQVVALQQVQAVGGRLRELVVVGPPPCRRLEQHLAAVLPASCRAVVKKEWCPHSPGGGPPWRLQAMLA